MKPDFGGYATKVGMKCSDGRTIMPDAFSHAEGQTVPLVWQHGHNDPQNVLGHAILESRSDGVYAHGFFNSTDSANQAKALVQHGDIKALSIYANGLVEKSKQVFHGTIRELSLVLSGANPGAFIDNVSIAHSDGTEDLLEDEAVIYTDDELTHFLADQSAETLEHAEKAGRTVQDVYDAMSEEQKDVVHFMIGTALESKGSSAEHSNISENEEGLTHTEEGSTMHKNVFDNTSGGANAGPSLSHDQLMTIVSDAQKIGSFKESFLAHAVDYGIENIDILFPDARLIENKPEFVSRRMEWVSSVLSGTRKSPFSRIKTISADITHDEARAKGYVKATLKKEEWFGLASRVTTPTTVYKKQKLDRDDIVDITDLDVVMWLKAEMRVMLDEEIARAILIGDGRDVSDDDKINETNIRPIAREADFYCHKTDLADTVAGDDIVEAVVRARVNYRGRGNPTMYCTEALLTELLLIKDGFGRRLYPTQAELSSALRVSNIVPVEVMEGETVVVDVDGTDTDRPLLAILVNLGDYTVGADKGGQVSMFDDFDIDYNQYKYLIEGRLSGALTKFKTAMTISGGAPLGVAPAV